MSLNGGQALEPGDGTKAVRRAFRILEHVAQSGESGLTLADCASELGLSKVTCLRVLQALRDMDYLIVDEERGTYRLGVRTLRLGMRYLGQLELRREAHPIMRELSSTTGETSHLGVLQRHQIVYIDKVESNLPVRMASRIGDAVQAHCTAIGKAILAYTPETEVAEIVGEMRFERKTANTITDAGAFQVELRRIRAAGFAIDDEENEEGIRCIAAAIFDHTDRPVGGVSVSGPLWRMEPGRYKEVSHSVRRAAVAISARLGHDADSLTVRQDEAGA